MQNPLLIATTISNALGYVWSLTIAVMTIAVLSLPTAQAGELFTTSRVGDEVSRAIVCNDATAPTELIALVGDEFNARIGEFIQAGRCLGFPQAIFRGKLLGYVSGPHTDGTALFSVWVFRHQAGIGYTYLPNEGGPHRREQIGS